LLAASLALSACGSRGGSDNSSTAGGNSSAKVAKIGVIAPLSGDLSALGLGIKNSVDLAIKQANEPTRSPAGSSSSPPRTTRPSRRRQERRHQALAGDKRFIGVVGTLNSSVALQVQPVLALRTSSRSRPPTPTRP
jgi:branched-chain amino acid transport system substrate-binding protein